MELCQPQPGFAKRGLSPILFKRDGAASLGMWHVLTFSRITIGLLRRRSDHPVIGGDLTCGRPRSTWLRGSTLMCSQLTLGFTQPGEKPVTVHSGETESLAPVESGSTLVTMVTCETRPGCFVLVRSGWSLYIDRLVSGRVTTRITKRTLVTLNTSLNMACLIQLLRNKAAIVDSIFAPGAYHLANSTKHHVDFDSGLLPPSCENMTSSTKPPSSEEKKATAINYR